MKNLFCLPCLLIALAASAADVNMTNITAASQGLLTDRFLVLTGNVTRLQPAYLIKLQGTNLVAGSVQSNALAGAAWTGVTNISAYQAKIATNGMPMLGADQVFTGSNTFSGGTYFGGTSTFETLQRTFTTAATTTNTIDCSKGAYHYNVASGNAAITNFSNVPTFPLFSMISVTVSNGAGSAMAFFVTAPNVRLIGNVTSNGIQIASGKVLEQDIRICSNFTNWAAAAQQ